MEILSAINDVDPDQEAVSGTHPVEVDVGEISRLQQLIMWPGESGGVITRTEFEISKFCAEEKLGKKTSDRLHSMFKRRDFVIEDIRAETIRELETLVSDYIRSKISENVHMWQYGRPQPRTISVEERHARLAKARQASGQKRESRKELLADRKAQRRATLQDAA